MSKMSDLHATLNGECAYPTEPDMTIGVGDKVRSFDFPGQCDSFVEGTVTGFREYDGCRRYIVETRIRVLGGEIMHVHVPHEVYPPLNGTPTWHGVCRGVAKV
jgi:hypothetical protein